MGGRASLPSSPEAVAGGKQPVSPPYDGLSVPPEWLPADGHGESARHESRSLPRGTVRYRV